MCVTLMLSSLITTLYVQRGWVTKRVSKLMRGLIPSKSPPCEQLAKVSAEIKALKSSSSEGVIVTEITEEDDGHGGPDGDFYKPSLLEPFRTGPSMINLTRQ